MRSEVFGNPAFTRFWLARGASGFAYQMSAVAIGWQIYALTGNVFNLGLAGLMEFLPQFLLTLVVGHVADRVDRRLIVVISQFTQCLLAAFLAAGTLGRILSLHGIFACIFLIGIARAFETPSIQALLPGLVPPDELPSRLAFAGSVFKFSVIAGPALGGFLYVAGPEIVYATAAGVSLAGSICVAGIQKAKSATRKPPASLRSVLGGIEYIRAHPDILGAISLDLFAVLLGGATSLLPVYAKDILRTGPWGLGILRAAPSVGALAMSLYLTKHTFKRNVGRTMFIAVAVFGIATVVFGLSRSLALSVAALLVLGASDMISVVIRATLVQLDTPDELRGRVSAVNAIFIGTSNQLGDFESGLMAAWLGAVSAVVAGGVGTLAVVALWMRFFPGLRRRDTLTARE